MKLAGFIFLVAGLLQCGDKAEVIHCFALECAIEATVKDLSGLDGCGMVFELKDGTILEPERRAYIQPPSQEQDPLYYFELRAGDKVQISYQATSGASACMAGKTVFITCIKLSANNSIE